MTNALVQVPLALLLSPDLPASAKLIWMVAALRLPAEGAGTAWLAATAGVSRPTVLKGLAQLAAAGWDPTRAGDPGLTISVPAALLANRKLGPHARVAYGLLLLTPGFRHPCGQFTYAELASLAHADPKTLARAIRELARAEWISVERAHRRDRIHFELRFPGLARGLEALAAAERRLERAEFFGEGLMREYLSLLIDSDEYEDDAAPGFLVNPRTDERLQLDRFYPPRVAFEFNGPQHYRETERFSAAEAVGQRERDYIKLGICVTRGITLVIIHPEDLALQAMRGKVAALLPPRDLTGYELLTDYLETESRRYRRLISRI